MKEITFPVLVLNDDCRQCEDIDIVSINKSRIYADNVCVTQEIQVRCANVYRCKRIQERLQKMQGRE